MTLQRPVIDQVRLLDALVLTLSTRFINVQVDEIDGAIEDGLRSLVEALGIERSTIYRFSADETDMRMAHIWTRGDTVRVPQYVRPTEFPWVLSILRDRKPVIFSSLDEIPEGAADRRSFGALGLRSHVTMPLLVSGELVGGLSCGSYARKRDWSDVVLLRLRRLADVFASLIARKRAEEALAQAMGLERLASSILALVLIGGPDNEDATIQRGLRDLGEFLDIDRATLWQWEDADAQIRVSYGWHSLAGGAPRDPIATTDLPWLSERLRAGEEVVLARIGDLPDLAATDRSTLEDLGLKSLLAAPLAAAGASTGGFVMSCTRAEREWSRTVVDGARLLAQVFASLLARRAAAARERAIEAVAAQDRAALQHMIRVDLLGQLSASIAHQLNQPLAAILGNAEAARTILGRDVIDLAEVRDICDDIISENNRAAEVIRRLGALYKRGEMTLAPVDLNALVDGTLELLRSEMQKREVRVETDLDAALPMVEGGEVQLQQVLLNLFLNAADAMAVTPAAQRKLFIKTGQAGGEVHIQVTDAGVGVPPEDIDTIFEAFWSTKPGGMGIGLAMCASIIAAHRGRVTAVNNDGAGATFSVSLPARQDL